MITILDTSLTMKMAGQEAKQLYLELATMPYVELIKYPKIMEIYELLRAEFGSD